MGKYQSFEKLIINFDTGAIPPPFCYKYSIKFINHSGKFKATLDLEYYDRDEITEEEIFDEGFTLEDDFHWEGEIPVIWREEIVSRLSSTNFSKSPQENNQGFVIEFRIVANGQSEVIHPSDQKLWEVFAQEIIQAIFELGGKESPLKIQFLIVEKNKKEQLYGMTFRFSSREVEINSSKRGKPYTIDWKAGQKLLQHIYFFDYLPEDAISKPSAKAGSYIDPGDGFWYSLEMNEANSKLNERKEKLITTLNSYF